MANARTFIAQALTTNGVDVDGLADLSFQGDYTSVQSTPDGVVGVEDVDRAGLDVNATLTCADVLEGANILAGAAGDTKWRCKESGAATWHSYLIDQATDGWIVWHGMALNFPKDAYGVLTCNGKVAFAAAAKNWGDVFAATGGSDEAAAILATRATGYAVRKYRPNNGLYGSGPGIAITHVDSLNLSLTGRVINDYADLDIGQTAVDVAGWNPLDISLVCKDATIAGAENIVAQLEGVATRADLTIDLEGAAGAAAVTLTVKTPLITGVGQIDVGNDGYATFPVTMQAGWRFGGTEYGLASGTELFAFA
jgi:hypothetical protein